LSFFKELREVQACRDGASLVTWPEGPHRDAAILIGRALQMALNWPTAYFLPGDRFNAVAYGPRFRSLDDGGWDMAALAIEGQLSRRVPDRFWQQCSDQDISLGEVVAALVALPHAVEQPKKRWRLWR
jgi:hypothetical protein